MSACLELRQLPVGGNSPAVARSFLLPVANVLEWNLQGSTSAYFHARLRFYRIGISGRPPRKVSSISLSRTLLLENDHKVGPKIDIPDNCICISVQYAQVVQLR